MSDIRLQLPWPPSVNSAYRVFRSSVYKTQQAKDYTKEVCALVKAKKVKGLGKARVRVAIQAYPPDRRKRDLDNIQKILLDSLEQAGLFDDDSQIDRLEIMRGPAVVDGLVIVLLTVTGEIK